MISENFDNLFKAASSVREQAHVPYSNFKVGAAFLTEDNTIITGFGASPNSGQVWQFVSN